MFNIYTSDTADSVIDVVFKIPREYVIKFAFQPDSFEYFAGFLPTNLIYISPLLLLVYYHHIIQSVPKKEYSLGM